MGSPSRRPLCLLHKTIEEEGNRCAVSCSFSLFLCHLFLYVSKSNYDFSCVHIRSAFARISIWLKYSLPLFFLIYLTIEWREYTIQSLISDSLHVIIVYHVYWFYFLCFFFLQKNCCFKGKGIVDTSDETLLTHRNSISVVDGRIEQEWEFAVTLSMYKAVAWLRSKNIIG